LKCKIDEVNKTFESFVLSLVTFVFKQLTIKHEVHKARPNDRYPENIAKLDHSFCRAGDTQRNTKGKNMSIALFVSGVSYFEVTILRVTSPLN
jgi:hypothetical protein